MNTQWFLTRNGETIAQYSTEEFRAAVAKRVLRPTDYVRRSDSSTYISAAEFLPASYQPRSAAPRVIGGIAAFLVVFLSAWTLASMAAQHIFVNALSAIALMDSKPAGSADTVSREALRQLLLHDASNGNFYQVLSEKDPQAFETLLDQFAGSVDLSKPDEAALQVRAYLMKSIIEPKMRDLPDEDKAEMLKLNRDTSLQLATTNPNVCIAQALGRPAGDLKPYLTPELSERETRMMLRMLDTTPQHMDLLPASDLQALNAKVGRALYDKHGEEVGLLDLENVAAGKEEAACRMFAAYLDEVLTLPQAESTALIRAMMTDSSRLSEQQPAEAQPAQAPAVEPPLSVPAPAPKAATGAPASEAPAAGAEPSAEFPSGQSTLDTLGTDSGSPAGDAADTAPSDPDAGPPVDLQAQQ